MQVRTTYISASNIPSLSSYTVFSGSTDPNQYYVLNNIVWTLVNPTTAYDFPELSSIQFSTNDIGIFTEIPYTALNSSTSISDVILNPRIFTSSIEISNVGGNPTVGNSDLLLSFYFDTGYLNDTAPTIGFVGPINITGSGTSPATFKVQNTDTGGTTVAEFKSGDTGVVRFSNNISGYIDVKSYDAGAGSVTGLNLSKFTIQGASSPLELSTTINQPITISPGIYNAGGAPLIISASILDIAGNINGTGSAIYFRSGSLTSSLQTHIITYDPVTGLLGNASASTPGQPQNSIQFNSESKFVGSSRLVYLNSSSILILTGSLIASGSWGFIDTNQGFFAGSEGQPSVYWTGRSLRDTGGSTSVDWQNRQLILSNASVFDWSLFEMYDSIGYKSINWSSRSLKDNNENIALTWTDTGSSNGVRLYGTSSYALVASSSNITFGSNNTNYYLTFVPGGLANYPIQINANLPYNPVTRNLGATNTYFLGTASFATSSISSSFATNAISSSFSTTSSFVVSSSYALTASYAMNGGGGGGSPGGGQYDIQTNDGAGGFAGDAKFKYKSTDNFFQYESDTDFGSSIINNNDIGRHSILNSFNQPQDQGTNPCKFRSDLIPWTVQLPLSTNSIVTTFRPFAASLDPLRVLGFKCDYCLTLKDSSDYFSGTRVGTLMASWDYDTTYNPVIMDSSISGDQTYSVLQNPTFSLSWNGNIVELYLDNTTIYNVIFTGLFTVFTNKS